jgi:polyisoprenoid-binding protein YceI
MALTDGSYRLGPEQGQVLVKTGRTGLGRRAGHDLTIEATRWSADAVVNTADPGQSSVTVTIDAGSLEPREGTGGLKPLTDSDRADIKKTICSGKCLRTDEHPQITFTSTKVTGSPESFTITGDLTIVGNTQPVTVQGRVDDDRIRGTTTIAQTRWGIKPYSGVGGLLKLADEVQIQFDVATPA